VYSKADDDLEWWKKAIIYQIYPKSFYDTDNNGIGDVRGVIAKLDYLKSINIGAIWLNPIFKSGGKDGGYDVASFTEIDELYGTMNDFKELVSEAHKRG
jgi:glycosidase